MFVKQILPALRKEMQKWLKATQKKDSGLVSRPFVLNWGGKMCENYEKNIWSKDNEEPHSETGWNKTLTNDIINSCDNII